VFIDRTVAVQINGDHRGLKEIEMTLTQPIKVSFAFSVMTALVASGLFTLSSNARTFNTAQGFYFLAWGMTAVTCVLFCSGAVQLGLAWFARKQFRNEFGFDPIKPGIYGASQRRQVDQGLVDQGIAQVASSWQYLSDLYNKLVEEKAEDIGRRNELQENIGQTDEDIVRLRRRYDFLVKLAGQFGYKTRKTYRDYI